ncbi:hypothetical protein Dsin_003451 [Dipteronia sinensis]|uniref:J domain-containing protein required for chloroplast accumulation response 1 n=1 Tax=Dipteronia sinensis TaxID=43782 RepID=A0AAE0B913_9ROSI|nr:hypothetical protein Dsin_003451 [Dipteronia sinensis]
MERFSQRESVLLGYGPQRSFINESSSSSSSKTPYRHSDVDFNDVFGGPPRRTTIDNHELRSFSEATTDDNGLIEDGETVVYRNSWHGISEKPVFGEEGSTRRRYQNENFFNDIFRGNESSSSSPRKREWDPYSSSLSSRVLSPARPLPPKAEPFGTPVPAQFSLPAELMKVTELPTFGSSPRSPYKSKDGASNGSNYFSRSHSISSSLSQSQEERDGTKSAYRQSLLSRELSSSNLIGYDETDTGGNSKEESKSSEGVTNGNQFHFSIYKWAGKGVPLVMPLRGGSNSRLKESDNTEKSASSGGESKARELSIATLHDSKLPSNDKESVAINKFPVMEQDKQDNGSLPDTNNRDKVEPRQIVDPGKTISQSTGEEAKLKKNISVVAEETPKPELKPLHLLLNDQEKGNEEITNKASGKESKVKSTKISSVVVDFSKNAKKQDGKKTTSDSPGPGAGKVSWQGSPRNSGDSGKTRVKGKVKEFVKIFSHDAFSKPKINVGSQSQSSRWKEMGTSNPEKEAKISKIGTDTKTHMPNRHDKRPLSDASVAVDEHLQRSEKQHSATKNANHISPQKKDSSITVPNDSKAVAGDVDETFQVYFQVKELGSDEIKMTQAGNDPEEIQDIDARIRKWLNGKEGNIRSLLSTLQYVLWTGSGWKPVPLVDIIEANAVKRSYQKALLCLHPDKLQQKGAASHQKYTAEKVFGILQDAWTHFNSLGSL